VLLLGGDDHGRDDESAADHQVWLQRLAEDRDAQDRADQGLDVAEQEAGAPQDPGSGQGGGREAGVAGAAGCHRFHDSHQIPQIECMIIGILAESNCEARWDGLMTFDTTALLDETGRDILGILQQEGRLPLAELGRRVNLSPPAVAERVRRLESAGIIRGYRADIAPAAVGLTITAIINVLTRPDGFPEVIKLAQELPEVVECHRATGHGCFVLKVHATSIQHLESVLDRIMPHGEPTTSVVLSSPVAAKPVTPPAR
jgi:Lrp/AsnC family transcriptional regulator, leucine-responsive regulatory protein